VWLNNGRGAVINELLSHLVKGYDWKSDRSDGGVDLARLARRGWPVAEATGTQWLMAK
jgi:hypothetical protein